MDNGLNGIEIKRRTVRWWINTASSLVVLGFGGYLLLMRYAFGHNPLRGSYWLITGLVLGFGAFRLGMQLWRRAFLFADADDAGEDDIKKEP
ncbi:MAG: hypothetical protein QME74_07330 [Candidatus Edwardsbacteria bacterium]|nr:hypothetical protein [Candidatus Edwardsbacteria bacterium]